MFAARRVEGASKPERPGLSPACAGAPRRSGAAPPQPAPGGAARDRRTGAREVAEVPARGLDVDEHARARSRVGEILRGDERIIGRGQDDGGDLDRGPARRGRAVRVVSLGVRVAGHRRGHETVRLADAGPPRDDEILPRPAEVAAHAQGLAHPGHEPAVVDAVEPALHPAHRDGQPGRRIHREDRVGQSGVLPAPRRAEQERVRRQGEADGQLRRARMPRARAPTLANRSRSLPEW